MLTRLPVESASAESMNQSAYWLASCLDSQRNKPPRLSDEIRLEMAAEQAELQQRRRVAHVAQVIDIMEARGASRF